MAPACVGKEGHIAGGVFDHSTHEEDPQHLPEQRSPAAGSRKAATGSAAEK